MTTGPAEVKCKGLDDRSNSPTKYEKCDECKVVDLTCNATLSIIKCYSTIIKGVTKFMYQS